MKYRFGPNPPFKLIWTLRPVQAGTGIEDVSDLVHMDAEIERYPRPDTHLPLLNWDPSLANF